MKIVRDFLLNTGKHVSIVGWGLCFVIVAAILAETNYFDIFLKYFAIFPFFVLHFSLGRIIVVLPEIKANNLNVAANEKELDIAKGYIYEN